MKNTSQSAFPDNSQTPRSGVISIVVIVASLGYFVDIYDLLLFGIVRLQSLKDMGLTDERLSTVGAAILNWQMFGLLLGGVLWGIIGDKKGRLSVLFGSILTYSIANICCGFVTNPDVYKLLRFIAGIGLAGELGAGITLVTESLPKKSRAIGTSLVASIGLFGAVVAYFTVKLFSWRHSYFIGGGLGLGLLLLRMGVFESGMFNNIQKQANVKKGDFFAFFTNKRRFVTYMKCIAIGIPTWFIIAILATFSNEFGKALGVTEPIEPGLAIMWSYVGLATGDFASGFLSHGLKSRKKAVLIMMAFSLLGAILYLGAGITNPSIIYGLCLWMGAGIGYWAMFVTIAAEQFGTNLRATAATTVPNMVRGAVVLMTSLYAFVKPSVGVLVAGAVVGLIAYILGFYAAITIPETHDKDLDFLEQ